MTLLMKLGVVAAVAAVHGGRATHRMGCGALDEFLRGEEHDGAKAPLPGSRGMSVTERPCVELPQHVRSGAHFIPAVGTTPKRSDAQTEARL